jgi:adenine-specific DNA-methyltransferase
MALNTTQLKKLKELFQSFIDNNAFKDKEEHVQSSYILPILSILNWGPSRWKVNTSQEIKTGKRPDILLKGHGGGTIFVVESKEPNVHHGLDGKYEKWSFIEQLSFYCEAEGVSWGLLTNFVEWRIYNSHTKSAFKRLTVIKDKKSLASDDDLVTFFGLLDYNNLNLKKGKISIEEVYYKKQEQIKEEFFESLKKWRRDLRNFLFKEYDRQFSPSEVDTYTQRILDRLIFIDVCFDKGIIPQNYLGQILLSEGRSYYSELKIKFKALDDKFNSELFARDKCDEFDIPNEVLGEIIKGISFIDFSQLSVHIIGEVYENYLGELLRAGKEKITTTDSKFYQKRKSQGIFYTPDYIVDNIIKTTIGSALENCKSEKDIEKIKLLDPACGSGSFLIRAFDEFYRAYLRVRKKQIGLFDDLEIRRKILLQNIFGVDLDSRAVEIAKLNLLLKALEGLEEPEQDSRGIKLLPNLSLNIRCGNSLISSGQFFSISKQVPDDRDDSQRKEDIEELLSTKNRFYVENDSATKAQLIRRVQILESKINSRLELNLKPYFKNLSDLNVFNFDVSFCEVMKEGGFNAIVGNPPFVQLSNEAITIQAKSYYINRYKSSMGRLNTFGFFVKLGIDLLKEKGSLGFIIPNTVTTQDYYADLRQMILDSSSIQAITNFDKLPFKDAVVENIIIQIQKNKNSKSRLDNLVKIVTVNENQIFSTEKTIKQEVFTTAPGQVFKTNYDVYSDTLKDKIRYDTIPIEKLLEVNQAIALKEDRSLWVASKKENENYRPLLVGGRNINRYAINWDGSYLNYNIEAIHSCKREDIFLTKEKIFFRRVDRNLVAAIDTKKLFALHTLVVMNQKVLLYDLRYYLAIFNSKLMNFYYKATFASTKKVFSEIGARQVKQLPIKNLNLENSADKVLYDKIIFAVNDITALNKDGFKNQIKIAAADDEINSLVYALYNLDKSEKNYIEDSLNSTLK